MLPLNPWLSDPFLKRSTREGFKELYQVRDFLSLAREGKMTKDFRRELLFGKQREHSFKMLTKEIVDKEVIGSDGFKLGKVRDTEFDENTWKFNSLEVHLEKDVAEEHHLRHRFRKTTVLINVDHVQSVGDRVILKGSKEDLLKLIASAISTLPEEQKEQQREVPESVAGDSPRP